MLWLIKVYRISVKIAEKWKTEAPAALEKDGAHDAEQHLHLVRHRKV